jgi:hypothetical protein
MSMTYREFANQIAKKYEEADKDYNKQQKALHSKYLKDRGTIADTPVPDYNRFSNIGIGAGGVIGTKAGWDIARKSVFKTLPDGTMVYRKGIQNFGDDRLGILLKRLLSPQYEAQSNALKGRLYGDRSRAYAQAAAGFGTPDKGTLYERFMNRNLNKAHRNWRRSERAFARHDRAGTAGNLPMKASKWTLPVGTFNKARLIGGAAAGGVGAAYTGHLLGKHVVTPLYNKLRDRLVDR